jgi:hypothetical protein
MYYGGTGPIAFHASSKLKLDTYNTMNEWVYSECVDMERSKEKS